MTQVILNIKDNKVGFFMELVKNFEFVKIADNDMVIPEEHKKIVRGRIKKSEKAPSRLRKWNDVKHKIKL